MGPTTYTYSEAWHFKKRIAVGDGAMLTMIQLFKDFLCNFTGDNQLLSLPWPDVLAP